MNVPLHPAILRAFLFTILMFGLAGAARAQSAAVGTIEGRVVNTRTGEYLSGAHVTVEGTTLETFADADGSFRLTNVPAGTARVITFFTGLPPQTAAVTVTSGQVTQHDVSLGAAADSKIDSQVVRLDAFRVETSREMDAAALAINEQRFASNIKNVVSTDEFGNVAEGNAAEFLKFLPGVTIDYTGGNARDISINGVPSDNVPVTVDGFSVAAAANLGTNRAVQSDMISINNLSRIRSDVFAHARVARLSARRDGEHGAAQFVRALEAGTQRQRVLPDARQRPRFRQGPRAQAESDAQRPPRLRFRLCGSDQQTLWLHPLGGNFHELLAAGQHADDVARLRRDDQWRAFPHTTPDRPYLSAFIVQDAPKVTTRRSVGATVDYKLTPYDRVTFAFQYSSFDGRFVVHNINFNTVRVNPGDFTTTSTRGAPGAGQLQMNHQERNRFNRTHMPTFVWRHDGPVWKMDAGLASPSRAITTATGSTAFSGRR
jgi:hypothetical protein